MAFRGTFDYTLDAKNRLTVPAKFRPALGDGAVLAKGTQRCVAIWTPDAFDAYVQAALADMHPLAAEADEVNRFFQANSVDQELDSAGRVMLPGFLLEHAELTKDVVVTGVGSRLEVWDRAGWAAYNANLDIAKLTARFGQTPS
jgi:transcriptional regulator MraZ